MIENIKSFVNLLDELNVTSDQFLLMQLIYQQEYASLYRYATNNIGFNTQAIQDLLDKGYLKDTNSNSNTFNSDELEVTPKFSKLFALNNKNNAQEFWNTYPPYIWINNTQVAARNIDYDRFIIYYQQSLGAKDEMHKRVMAALVYAKKHDLICMGISKWILSRQWEATETLMSSDDNLQLPAFEEF